MGLGIVSMHYIGMAALHDSAHMTHDPYLVGAERRDRHRRRRAWRCGLPPATGRTPLFLSAVALGFAISGMHYTAMAAVTIYPHMVSLSSAPALSTDLLAIVVAIVAFVVSGLFFLVLVPERAPTREAAPRSEHESAEMLAASPPEANAVHDGRVAVVAAAAGAERPVTGEEAKASSPADLARHLPVERDGVRHLLPVDSIVAVHANAHYTYVFDGIGEVFLPARHRRRRITARSDPLCPRPSQPHHQCRARAPIQAGRRQRPDRAQRARRLYVPVSRSRLAWVRAQLARSEDAGDRLNFRRRGRPAAIAAESF